LKATKVPKKELTSGEKKHLRNQKRKYSRMYSSKNSYYSDESIDGSESRNKHEAKASLKPCGYCFVTKVNKKLPKSFRKAKAFTKDQRKHRNHYTDWYRRFEDGTYRKVRGKYFSVFREERSLLKLLLSSGLFKLNSKEGKYVYQYIYYSIIPKLFKYLSYPPDMEALISLEDHYYTHLRILRADSNNVIGEAYRLRQYVYRYVGPSEEISSEPSQ